MYKSLGQSFPTLADLKQHSIDSSKLNHPAIANDSKLGNVDEMDYDDMELYGDENSASEMDVDVSKSSLIDDADMLKKPTFTRDTYWSIIYGEEGWLRVSNLVLNIR